MNRRSAVVDREPDLRLERQERYVQGDSNLEFAGQAKVIDEEHSARRLDCQNTVTVRNERQGQVLDSHLDHRLQRVVVLQRAAEEERGVQVVADDGDGDVAADGEILRLIRREGDVLGVHVRVDRGTGGVHIDRSVVDRDRDARNARERDRANVHAAGHAVLQDESTCDARG